MKTLLISSLILLCTAPSAFAKRAPYTIESIKYATHIGIWSSRTIDSTGRLKMPTEMLMGNFKTLDQVATVSYSKYLKDAIKTIQGSQNRYTLLITIHQGKASLTNRERARLEVDYNQRKATKRLIEQIQQKRKWKTYSTREQIERSDVIVTGRLFTAFPCGRSSWIVTQKVYRGVPPKKPKVCLSNWEKEDSLFFLQRQYGSGPEFMVMHAVPLKDAAPYLKQLKEFKKKPAAAKEKMGSPQ